ncbi:hypothetical protein ABGB16_32505 [Micromonospora sp. B11E3]
MSMLGDEELRAEMEATDGDDGDVDGVDEVVVSVGHVFFAFVAAL